MHDSLIPQVNSNPEKVPRDVEPQQTDTRQIVQHRTRQAGLIWSERLRFSYPSLHRCASCTLIFRVGVDLQPHKSVHNYLEEDNALQQHNYIDKQ